MLDQIEPADSNTESYRRSASGVFKNVLQARFAADRMAAAYGKWIFQSLLLLHSGSIAGTFIYLSGAPSHRLQVSAAIPFFFAGIIMILLAGFAAWAHWSAIADAFRQQADPWMIEDHSRHPKGPSPRTRLIKASMWASVSFGFMSGLFLIFGAAVVILAVLSSG